MSKEKIVINGEEHEIASGKNLDELLDVLELEKRSIAIELNQNLIPKSEWVNHIVKSGDKIEIVQFVGGGF
ncbi:sulfur carrier protein ThiS [Pseudaquidulcibacter saccharophilus]|uniref:sulfur carrier protein ThiS n=1 Tax=Pseudaquidulcibacter saccharophilus TaxID=2831900 RepID=UPI001EFF403D|nr:sulfur carrier protein ThiS [Pseudaquidulcibacter saccharophilus]